MPSGVFEKFAIALAVYNTELRSAENF